MSADDLYTVANSQAVADQFRLLAEEARATGQLPIFLRSARWIVEELARTPNEFGESREQREGDGLMSRCGFAGPVYVEYAIH
jgi:hypothetical protein